MNLAGGDCVNDLVKLEGDSGFCRVLRWIEFAIGCDVTPECMKSVLETEGKDGHSIYEEFDGKRIKTNQETSPEVCFVPSDDFGEHAAWQWILVITDRLTFAALSFIMPFAEAAKTHRH
jgi:hypothetical protein